MEAYLSLQLPQSVKKAITQIRTGCHKLPIARGRLITPEVEIQQRTCKFCPTEVCDEIHFLLFCNHLQEERKILAQQWGTTIPHQSALTRDPLQVEMAVRDLLTPTEYHQALDVGNFIKKELIQF